MGIFLLGWRREYYLLCVMPIGVWSGYLCFLTTGAMPKVSLGYTLDKSI